MLSDWECLAVYVMPIPSHNPNQHPLQADLGQREGLYPLSRGYHIYAFCSAELISPNPRLPQLWGSYSWVPTKDKNLPHL